MDETTFEYWQDKKVVDSSGDKIGSIEDVYIDEATGKREWLIVSTGLFGRNAVIPAQNLTTLDDDTIQVPFSKQQVKDSPHMDADGELSEQEERELYDYYGISYSAESSPSVYADESSASSGEFVHSATEGYSESGIGEVEGTRPDSAMTRSEEELSLHKERQPREIVRLHKRVRTEPVQKTVPVEREEVVVEREPITSENYGRAVDGPEITENVHEEVLSDEEVVAEKHVEPKERVRLDKQAVTEEETVSEDVRKEEIDVEREGQDKGDIGRRAA